MVITRHKSHKCVKSRVENSDNIGWRYFRSPKYAYPLGWIELTIVGILVTCGDRLHSHTVQITFIFIDFRVCDFAFAFKLRFAFYTCFIIRQISICVLNANETFVWLVNAFDASYIAHYRSNGYAPLHRTLSLKWIWPAVSETLVLNETKHTKSSQITDQYLRKEANAKCAVSVHAKREFLSQFRKVRNAFECFVAQVQTQLPKTKRVWPMKINVICTVC